MVSLIWQEQKTRREKAKRGKRGSALSALVRGAGVYIVYCAGTPMVPARVIHPKTIRGSASSGQGGHG